MKCEIIAVGTELLLGNIVNTNAQYLSEKLAELGLDVYYHTVVGDNMSRIVDTIQKSLERCDIIITTGGLGPTDDDLTKEGVAAALGLELIPHEPSLQKIEGFFKTINRPMAKCNIKQGYIPQGSHVLQNDNGTAPGILAEKNGKTVILLPGPPKELIPMFEEQVAPYLRAKTGSLLKSKTLKIVGVGESSVQELLKDIFDAQTNPTIAPYAKSGEVHLRITAKAEEEAEADRLIGEMQKKVEERLRDSIYGYDGDTLESVVIKLLTEKNKTIATAESCTGGLIGSRLTDIPGASACLLNGIISYSNEAKEKFLNVRKETLMAHGAVSHETAYEMAEGAAKVSGTNIGVSVTGIAGPDGGTKEKPVGLFYIGLYIDGQVETHKFIFPGKRATVKLNASTRALDIVRKALLKIK